MCQCQHVHSLKNQIDEISHAPHSLGHLNKVAGNIVKFSTITLDLHARKSRIELQNKVTLHGNGFQALE